MYPNPTTSDVFVEWGDHSVTSIEVRNTMGQLITTVIPTGNAVTIDMQGLESGVYFVRVNAEKGTRVESIQKL
jgi:hypothetical protein